MLATRWEHSAARGSTGLVGEQLSTSVLPAQHVRAQEPFVPVVAGTHGPALGEGVGQDGPGPKPGGEGAASCGSPQESDGRLFEGAAAAVVGACTRTYPPGGFPTTWQGGDGAVRSDASLSRRSARDPRRPRPPTGDVPIDHRQHVGDVLGVGSEHEPRVDAVVQGGFEVGE